MAKKDEQKIAGETLPPAPSRPSDQLSDSGWGYYAKKEYFRAEEDFRKALELSPDDAELFYALGMTYQASDRQADAISAFEKAIQLLENVQAENQVRAHMMTRLARGHINIMKTGDWNLGG
ncbi:MAG TPA: tetratricopeptide repeat protein [Anaerolineaceae bacterium]